MRSQAPYKLNKGNDQGGDGHRPSQAQEQQVKAVEQEVAGNAVADPGRPVSQGSFTVVVELGIAERESGEQAAVKKTKERADAALEGGDARLAPGQERTAAVARE